MLNRKLGKFEVSAIGLGCMPLSGMPLSRAHMLEKRDQAIATVHAALDAGITLLDTADIYSPTWNSMGHNEILVAEALRTWNAPTESKRKIVIATKGGITRGPGGDWFGTAGRNANEHYLYRAVEASAARLGRSSIQVWHHHRLDPSLTFQDQFQNVLKLKEHGYIENIGLSNINISQLNRAIELGGTPSEGGIVSVQNEFSPRYRHSDDVRERCQELGIAFLPWSPLGGIGNDKNLEAGNYGSFDEVAKKYGVSAFAITVAWHLATSSVSIPIPGATRIHSILDTLQGVGIQLSDEDLALLNTSLPPPGPIHPELVDVDGL
jgi:aryl-alcohol dehydrogenase-like predicted oxidoreductase